MTSGWLREHNAFAAVVFVAISLALTGLFAWLERHFKRG
jgi:ABC-type amino acid transport system permease subunit